MAHPPMPGWDAAGEATSSASSEASRGRRTGGGMGFLGRKRSDERITPSSSHPADEIRSMDGGHAALDPVRLGWSPHTPCRRIPVPPSIQGACMRPHAPRFACLGLAWLGIVVPPAGAATDKIVVSEFLIRCADARPDGAFVELA